MAQLVLLEFGRQRIERLDFSPCLSRYGLDRLPSNPRRLRSLMGSLVCIIHGYDHDTRELHCIPEVRRFVREFHRIWPYWMFFFCAEPGISTYEVFVGCCLDRLSVTQRNGANLTLLEGDPMEVAKFLGGELQGFLEMCGRAELLPEHRVQRLRQVFTLFGLLAPQKVAQSITGTPVKEDGTDG